MTTLAGTIITRVRDIVPDPIYSGATPQPDADGGLFRASSLYGWLDDGVKLMTERLNWSLLDWYAMPLVALQPIYPVSALWAVIDQVYAQQRRLKVTAQQDSEAIYPDRASGAGQNMAYVFRVTDHIDLGVEPVPTATDALTSLDGVISAQDRVIVVASVAGFLSYGFALIESELVQYQSIDVPTRQLRGVTRGAGGTTAVAHASQVSVTHCSLWVKGPRTPMGIVSSVSVVEVPLPWVSLLNHYLLAQCLESQQETQRAESYLKRFDLGCDRIGQKIGGRDPITRQPVAPEPPAAAPMPTPAAAPGG